VLKHFRDARFIKIMLWTVALSFIALIVFEWGADFSGRSQSVVGDTVGSVNGEELSYEQFDQILRNTYQQERQQGQTNPDLGNIIRQTWDRFVAETIVRQQVEKYRITASDREIDFLNRSQPPSWVQNVEIFQTEGSFDLSKYHAFLNDPATYSNPQGKQFVLAMEDAARQSMLNHKLQGLLVAGARVSNAEARDHYVRKNESIRVAYAGFDARGIPDSIVSVSQQEIADYYAGHRYEFHQDASVRSSFIGLPKTPTLADEADIESEIRRIRRQVVEGEDFADLAESFSDDPGSAARGGDLGFFKREQMVKPFEERAFTLAPGEVSDPFRTQFGWHVLKVEGREGEGDSTRIHARHILLSVTAGRATIDSLQLVLEEFRDLAESSGFDVASQKVGLEVQETGFISSGSFFPLLTNKTTGLVNGFLEADLGQTSATYETDDGMYIFALRERRPAGPRPLSEVQDQIRTSLVRKKKAEAATQRLTSAHDAAAAGHSLEEAAEQVDATFAETSSFTREDFVPGIGRANEFVGAAFRLSSVGDLSPIVTTQGGAYILRLLERSSADDAEYDAQAPQLVRELESQKQGQLLTAWFDHLKQQADIIDNRHHFYYDF